MKGFKSIKLYDRLLLEFISKPIIKELPFLIFTFVIIGGVSAIRRIRGEIIVPDPKVDLVNLVGNMLVAFFFSYMLMLVIYYAAKKWLKITGYTVLISLFLIVSFIEENFDSRICPQVFTLLAETTTTESSEFLHVYALAPKSLVVYGRVLALIVLIILAEFLYGKFLSNYSKRINHFIRISFELFLCIIISSSMVYSGISFSKLFRCSTSDECSTWQPLGPQDTFTDIIYSVYMLNITGKEVVKAIDTTKNVVASLSVQDGDSINVILVIGESHIKWHSSLYKYPLPTNPFMEKEEEEGRLFVFEDVSCPNIRTSDNIKNILSSNCIGYGEKWFESPLVPSIFKKMGFHVSFFDNQRSFTTSSTAFALNSFLYNDDIVNLSYDQLNDTCFSYDGDIVDYYKNIRMRDKRNLIIFHLQGQHVEASEKYPHTNQFCKFFKDDIVRNEDWIDDAKRQIIAEYDNATLYNDYVLKKITELFENESTVMVYLSDHGEEVYDYRNQYGRKLFDKMTSDYVKYVYEIPFMIWCSDLFEKKHPTLIPEIKEASHKPFSSDNLCQIMFYLGGVKNSYYKSELNPMAHEYKCPKRIIEGRFLFDECRNRIDQ